MILSLLACNRIEEEHPEQFQRKELTVTAFRADNDTKTARQADGSVYWSPGDAISLFFRSGENGGSKFTAQNSEEVAIAQFKGTIDVISGGGEDSGGEFWFWGVYPYSAQNSCDGSSITTVIPTEQEGKAGTFADNTFITMARAKGLELGFYNICSGVKFTLTRDDIKEVRIRGNNGEDIAGKIKVEWDSNGKPAINQYVEGAKEVCVTAPGGGTFETGTAYYLVFAPKLFTQGFTLSLTTSGNKQGDFVYESERQFNRGIFINVSNLDTRVTSWVDIAAKKVPEEGGNVEFEVLSDELCHADIPTEAQSWISVVPSTKSVTQQKITLKIEANTGVARSATVLIKNESEEVLLSYTIEQKENHENQLALEREALIAIYDALDGDNWTDGYNNNWLSDKPVGEWSGVSIDDNGYVTYLYLTATGEIPSAILSLSHLKSLRINYYQGDVNREFPKCILSLSQLEYLHLYGQHLVGAIPSEIGQLKKLKHLEISDTKISGEIPESIGQLTQLEYLDLQWNQLSGELPASMGNLTRLRHLMLRRNKFIGNIPESIQALPIWKYDWGRVIAENNFNTHSLVIPAPAISGETLTGTVVNYSGKGENYFVLIQWSARDDDFFVSQISALEQMYLKYKSNVSFVGLISANREESKESVETYISNKGITWPNIYWTRENNVIKGQELDFDGISRHEYAAPCFPSIFVFHNGKVVYWDLDVYGGVSGLDDYLSINVLGETPNYYISSDYSANGHVTTLQTASLGNGIDVVLMGDAFSDRQVADGTYAQVMQKANNALFSEEPYKSLKNYFNVYTVDVVSDTEGYDHDGQALSTWFGSGTTVGGNHNKVFEYAGNAVTEARMDDALIVVMMNKDAYAGTCYMHSVNSGDYGRGPSIAYFPTSSDIDTFNGLVSHEAGGHGFAKLGDEYAYEYMGAVPQSEIDDAQTMATYGWWKNVDFTSDPTLVKWSHFITDARYENEHVGCYEGAFTYWTGAWRPTENSIMRYNTGGFNAPSRYAIWYRIGKLANGANWEGSYEDFVTYDAINRTPAAAAKRQEQLRRRAAKPLLPLHAPVVVKHSWKEEMTKK